LEPSLRRFRVIAASAATVGIVLASLSGFVVAGAAIRPAARPDTTSSKPTVYEQTAYNENLAITAGNVHTTVATSPVLAEGNYLVNSEISFNNLTAGSQVLCGSTATASSDEPHYNYGDAETRTPTPAPAAALSPAPPPSTTPTTSSS
jgi:hypothetical protein